MYNNNNYPSIDVIKSKMDQVIVVPELSLGPSISIDQKSTTASSCLTSDKSTEIARSLKKRKSFNDHIVQTNNKPIVARRSLDDFFLRDGQVKRDRLPLDWEQCLDLKSGKIYFLNRKTAEKVWDRPTITDDHPHHQNSEKPLLELELNISSPTSSSCTHSSDSSFKFSQKTSLLNDQNKPTYTGHHCHPIKAVSDSRPAAIPTTTTTTTTSTTSCVVGSNNMVALACSNCHLLVILSKSSPSCPNCKYVHYLHSTDDQHDFKASPNRNMKLINTLSLFS